MEYTEVLNLIENFGFPIACVIALAVFVFIIYRDNNTAHNNTVTQIQENNKEREQKLYDEIDKNREVIAQAISTISMYAERLDVIQSDIKDIKTDVIRIDEKLN